MNFLSPWFLAGAALVVGPILFHLIRRSTRQRISFSATGFLSESPPRLQRRSRIDHPLLLLLRCLAIVALAFAFARPFFERKIPIAPSPAPPREVVAVLDESGSMQRGDLWQQARAQVQSLALDLDRADGLTVIGAADAPTVRLSPDAWQRALPNERAGLLAQSLPEQPTWRSSRLDLAIVAALDEIGQRSSREDLPAQGEVHVFSDFAEGVSLDALAGFDWPENVALRRHPLAAPQARNVGLRWLGWTGEQGGPHAKRQARIALAANRAASKQPILLTMIDPRDGRIVAEAGPIHLQAEEKRVALMDTPADFSGPAVIQLTGDGEDFDDQLYIAPPLRRSAHVHYVGPHASTDPTAAPYYLKRGLLTLEEPTVGWSEDSRLQTIDASDPALIIMDGVADTASAPHIESALRAGHHVLLLAHQADQARLLESLDQQTGWKIGMSQDQRYGLIGYIDFQHTLFSAFAEPRFSDFSRIRFWQTVAVGVPPTSSWQTLAAYESGDPLLLERDSGQGKLMVWAGGWAPEQGQWVLSSKFVPWLQGLVERRVGGAPRPTIADTDAIASLLPANVQSAWRMSPEQPFASTAPNEPGLYQLRADNVIRWVALQLPASESLTSPMEIDRWDQLGLPTHVTDASAPAFPDRREFMSASELEAEQSLWQWIIWAAMALLALESLWAIVLQNRRTSQASQA